MALLKKKTFVYIWLHVEKTLLCMHEETHQGSQWSKCSQYSWMHCTNLEHNILGDAIVKLDIINHFTSYRPSRFSLFTLLAGVPGIARVNEKVWLISYLLHMTLVLNLNNHKTFPVHHLRQVKKTLHRYCHNFQGTPRRSQPYTTLPYGIVRFPRHYPRHSLRGRNTVILHV